jgi:hypothetical protein
VEGIAEGHIDHGALSATPLLLELSAARSSVRSIAHSLRTGRSVVDFNEIEYAVS